MSKSVEGAGGGSWRLVIPWLLPPLVAVFAAGAAWLGVSQRSARPIPRTSPAIAAFRADCYMATKAGGYFKTGPVSQVSAQWVVPAIIAAGPTDEIASTWVGIQDTTGAFIQLGTHETARGGEANYDVFWSDTEKGDEAQPVFPVDAGNVVVADMTRTTKGWRLQVRDLTSGRSASFTLGYARYVHFTQADWTEEDPSRACTLGPYPDTATVALSSVKLNGKVPRLRYADATVLEAPNGVILVPTRVHDDGFSLQPPAGIRARYLDDTAPFNIALETFVGAVGQAEIEALITHVTSMVEEGTRLAALTTAQRALVVARHTRQGLASLPMSMSQRHYMRDVEVQLATLMSSLRRAITNFQRYRSWTLRSVEARSAQLQRTAARLRGTFSLPPPSGTDAPL